MTFTTAHAEPNDARRSRSGLRGPQRQGNVSVSWAATRTFPLAHPAGCEAPDRAFAAGLYVWAVSMIVVRELTLEVVEQTVKDLVSRRELESAFHSVETE
jgi:hypothetical protein